MSDIKISQEAKQILTANDLDFRIEKFPLQAQMPDGKMIDTNYFGLYNDRTGEVINSVRGLTMYHRTMKSLRWYCVVLRSSGSCL